MTHPLSTGVLQRLRAYRRLSTGDLAKMLGVPTEVVSAALVSLSDQGLIKLANGKKRIWKATA